MQIEIREVGADQLAAYASIPIFFTVKSVLRVEAVNHGLGGLKLVEEKVDTPYLKDFDSAGEGDTRPERWPKRFDVSNWAFFLAYKAKILVGGAAVAFDTPGVNMLEGRNDMAVLWDLRVHPDIRGRGVATALFEHAAEWVRDKGCSQLKIETSNVDVPACRFYAKQGCSLGAIHRFAYANRPDVAHETMLLWYLQL
jgi:GNAT superfamily N-acetyltransferase